jgi:hypothetical protein
VIVIFGAKSRFLLFYINTKDRVSLGLDGGGLVIVTATRDFRNKS